MSSVDLCDDGYEWHAFDQDDNVDDSTTFVIVSHDRTRPDNNPLIAPADADPPWWDGYEDPTPELVWLDVVAPIPPPNPPGDGWDWTIDDGVQPDVIASGYQQADYWEPLYADSWPHDDDAEDLTVFEITDRNAPVGPDFVPSLDQPGEAAWIEDDADDDLVLQHVESDAAPVVPDVVAVQPQPPDDAWPWDDDPAGLDIVAGSRQQSDAAAPDQPSAPAWPHDDETEDLALDLQLDAAAVGADFVAPAAQAPAGDDTPLDDDSSDESVALAAADSAPVGPDYVAPVSQAPVDGWIWDEDLLGLDVVSGTRQQSDGAAAAGPNQLFEDFSDEYDDEDYDLIIDDYCNVDPDQPPDDQWYADEVEDTLIDEVAAESRPVGADYVPPPAQPILDAWPHDDEAEDTLAEDAAIDSRPVGPDYVPPVSQCPDDQWSSDEVEDTLTEDIAAESRPVGQDYVAPASQAPAEAWSDDDVDDDLPQQLDSAPVPPDAALAQDPPSAPAWPHDDEIQDTLVDDAASSGPVVADVVQVQAQPGEDAWPHDDRVEDTLVDETANSAAVGPDYVPIPGQSAEDAWPWDDEVEDTLTANVAGTSFTLLPTAAGRPPVARQFTLTDAPRLLSVTPGARRIQV